MKELKHIVRDYIQQPSGVNYALMINGSWGSGKTHFVLNELKDSLIEASTEDGGCGKELIYVSLNGLGSPSQVLDEMIMKKIALYRWAKVNPSGKIISGLLGSALKIAANATSFSLLGKIMEPNADDLPKVQMQDLISFDPNKHVLCFDDLERVSSSFPIADVLGFINRSFVEHEGLNVLIIANEKEIDKKDAKKKKHKSDYDRIKEKVIGRTIHFKPNLHEIGNIFVQGTIERAQNERGAELLRDNEVRIIEQVAQSGYDNLRAVQYFLENLAKIASLGESTLLADLEQEVITCTLLLTFEENKGKLTKFGSPGALPEIFTDRFSPYKVINEAKYGGESRDEKMHRYNINIREHYLRGNRYQFFESIFSLVRFGYFEADLFKQELKEYHKSVLTPQEQMLEKMQGFRYLSNDRFPILFEKFKDYLEKGKYPLSILVEAVWTLKYLSDWNMIQTVSEQELLRFLKKGIEENDSEESLSKNIFINKFNTTLAYQELAKFDQLGEVINEIEEIRKSKDGLVRAKKSASDFLQRDRSSFDQNDLLLLIKHLPQQRLNETIVQLADNYPNKMEQVLGAFREMYRPIKGSKLKGLGYKQQEIKCIMGLDLFIDEEIIKREKQKEKYNVSLFWLRNLAKLLRDFLDSYQKLQEEEE